MRLAYLQKSDNISQPLNGIVITAAAQLDYQYLTEGMQALLL